MWTKLLFENFFFMEFNGGREPKKETPPEPSAPSAPMTFKTENGYFL